MGASIGGHSQNELGRVGGMKHTNDWMGTRLGTGLRWNIGWAMALLLWVSVSPCGRCEDTGSWPAWRGPTRDGTVADQWPNELDEAHLTLRWKKDFGDSYSGPIVAGPLVFTTETNGKEEKVHGLQLSDGTMAWSHAWEGTHSVPFFAARNGSWIRSTPSTDGKRLYIGGIRDVLVAIDCSSGKEVWRVDFGSKAGKVPDFGMASSPLVDGEYLYVQAGQGVHKLKSDDGSIVWTSLTDNGDMMSSGAFSSPIIATLSGKRQLVVQTRTFLAGVNLESGSELWKYEVAAFRGMNILTPTIWKEQIFTSSYGGKSLLIQVKNPATEVLWDNKIEGYMSSPVVIDHYLYMHLRNKRFACLDLETGKEAWITKPFGEYWSLVSNGSKILALDQTGKLRLIAHNPTEFQLLSERRVSEDEAWAHLAVVPGAVIVRSQKSLTVFDWK